MTEQLSSDQSQTEIHELNKTVDNLGNKSKSELIFLDWGYQLGEIKKNADKLGETEKNKLRPILKRIVLATGPQNSSSHYIKEHLFNFAYTPQEIDALKNEEKNAQERKQKIESDIAKGINPWLAHIKHNEKSLFNSYVVGFYQDDEGKIKTIYGPKHFKSKRQIESTIFGWRTENKEVNLLTGEFQSIKLDEILKGQYWNKLPEDLKERFEKGEILVTGHEDLYDLKEDELREVAKSKEPNALPETIDSKINNKVLTNKYFLLYYSDYAGNDNETGRTGIIMQAENGDIKPLIATVGDKEFIVEVKGCGKKSGGFGQMHPRTGRMILTGAAEAEQSKTEFYRLQDDDKTDSPKTIGSILFTNPEQQSYKQGYIIRLTPSTVRAAYTGIEAYPDIEKPEIVRKLLETYASQLAIHIFSDPPKILDRSSHSENILVWGNGRSAWTDYSDQIAFTDKNFPNNDNHGGYMTPKRMLEYYIQMVDEIPGYNKIRDKGRFYTDLMLAFKNYGKNLKLKSSDSYNSVMQKIWKNSMAFQVFKGRKEGKYIAEGVIAEFNEGFTWHYPIEELNLKSEKSFIEREAKGRKDMLMAINLLQSKLGHKIPEETIDEWRKNVKDGPLSDILHKLKIFRKPYADEKDIFTEEERKFLYDATDYYGEFNYALVNKIQEYFNHELDVIKNAKTNTNGNIKAELNQAENEIKTKMKKFTYLMDTNLGDFYRFINDPSQVKRLLTFRFYSH